MNTKEKIKVMQAYLDGQPIQYAIRKEGEWADWGYRREPNWNWEMMNYRIKAGVKSS